MSNAHDCPTCRGVMCPQHQEWDTFLDRLAEALAGPVAWATRWATKDTATIDAAIERGCQHGTFGTTRAILTTMGMDVEASLDFFRRHGVCCECDCEVIQHVEVTVNDPQHVCTEED